MNREIICLDCFWSGEDDKSIEVCPECGSDHMTYTDVLRRGLNVKTED